jgi:hypothetical protein
MAEYACLTREGRNACNFRVISPLFRAVSPSSYSKEHLSTDCHNSRTLQIVRKEISGPADILFGPCLNRISIEAMYEDDTDNALPIS